MMIANALTSLGGRAVDTALDIGCGPGTHLRAWSGYARKVFGIDQYAGQVDSAAFDSNTQLIAGDVASLPFDDNSIDLMFALDVIEHVPDLPTLSEARRVLKPGGHILVTVPAFQWLWSVRDEDAGHLRRYSSAQIREVVEAAGLKVSRIRYYQCLLFPLVVLSRMFGRRSSATRDMEDFPPRLMNAAFRAVNRLEGRIDALGLAMPFGSSLVVLARKP
ncbi:class I SAM-dependent methyltransferase [Hoeflea marina]|nr:class I SAM-dependent methyltransferase [Hoeflea marina]